jgi:S1-C subfamily serine protease
MKSLESSMFQLVAGGPQPPRVLAPAGQWGLVGHKPTGDDEAGVLVKTVLSGSAAADAGLQAGDRILTVDGRWTDSLIDLHDAASFVKPGSAVPISINRAGKDLELKLTPKPGL